MKETKAQAQERVFTTWTRAYNAIPDWDTFIEAVPEADKKVFTPQTFSTYFFKHIEGSKDYIKAMKEGSYKKGDVVISTVRSFQNEIRGQRYGYKKVDETLALFGSTWKVTPYATVQDKKLETDILKDFVLTVPGWGTKHYFISQVLGTHCRDSTTHLKSFIATAKNRKRYAVCM